MHLEMTPPHFHRAVLRPSIDLNSETYPLLMTQWGNTIKSSMATTLTNLIVATWGMAVTDDAKCELNDNVDKGENTNRKICFRCLLWCHAHIYIDVYTETYSIQVCLHTWEHKDELLVHNAKTHDFRHIKVSLLKMEAEIWGIWCFLLFWFFLHFKTFLLTLLLCVSFPSLFPTFCNGAVMP